VLASPDSSSPLAGWLSPTSGLLSLEEGEGLRFVGPEGETWGHVTGELADHVRARLEGRESQAPALFGAIARQVPGLEDALRETALRLSAPSALRRQAWGLLFVELTARCNERCVHCYVEAGPSRTEALCWETIQAVLRDAAELEFEIVQLTGGEALLSPHLVEAASLAHDLGIPQVEVYTNGVLLDERRYALLQPLGVSFAFSLYAADPARHDAITRLPGSHARTLKAIRLAQAGGSQVRVGVIAVTPEDEPHALAAAELAESLGVSVGIDVARSVGRGEHAGRPVPPRGEGTPLMEGPEEPQPEAEAPGVHGRSRAGKAAVLADGQVAPCIFSRALILGHVGPQGGLRSALERPRLRLTRSVGDLTRRLRDGACELACQECRVTAALLEAPQRLPQASTP
jgi:MoaA/NifB/PqqE/SkfB family radical SAM enzyme